MNINKNQTNKLKPIKLIPSVLLFLIPGIAFYVNINILVPFIADITNWNSYIIWMFTGTFFLFGLLFVLTFILLKIDGYTLDWQTIKKRLRLRKLTLKDLMWIIGGMLVCAIISGFIIWIYSLFAASFKIDDLRQMSPIKIVPLSGNQCFLLLFMPVFFFFNYVGEELLWRGYILPRQEITTYGTYAWIVNMLLHWVFHLAFSLEAMLFFLPFMLLMPYLVYKRKNTYISIIIHFLLGAPIQLFVALGIFR
jgi:membrane protease YdiL (CAAX protease family)